MKYARCVASERRSTVLRLALVFETEAKCSYLGAPCCVISCFFFFNDTATTEIYTLSLHDALPISLLARDRSLQVLAIGWLEGPTAQELLKGRRGERAGELAACWLRCAAALPVKVGLPVGAAPMVYKAGKEVVLLDAADRGLGSAARRLARILTQTLPKNGLRRLVHGTFYARHVLDQGDGVGVIDWERFGRGPLELDAGMFLATTWRYGLDHAPLAAEAARVEEALLAGTTGLLDERVLAWHRADASPTGQQGLRGRAPQGELAGPRARAPDRGHPPGRARSASRPGRARRGAGPSVERRGARAHAACPLYPAGHAGGAGSDSQAARRTETAGSERLIPADRQADRRADEADHAVGLDEVAPLLAGPGVDVLGQEAVPIAAGEHVLEQATRFLPPPECGERVDIPERAYEERVFRLPEIVGLDVAEDEVPSAQLALDGAHSAGEPGVVFRQKPQLAQSQQARVECLALHGGHKTAHLGIPGPLADDLMHARRLGVPIGGAVGESQVRGDPGQPIAAGPTHHARRRVHARRAAQLPDSGVWLIEHPRRSLAECFEAMEQDLVSAPHDPVVEEHVGGGQDGRAVDIVLDLPIRLIPDPHRPQAAVPGEGIDFPLVGDRVPADPICGLQTSGFSVGDDVQDVTQIALHRVRVAQPIEGVDHEVGVAQPAIAVVPVAPAPRCFGNRRRHRRDDRAGIFEHVELQGDGGANDRILPLEGNGEGADPFAPVGCRVLEEMTPDVRHGPLDGLVGPEQ